MNGLWHFSTSSAGSTVSLPLKAPFSFSEARLSHECPPPAYSFFNEPSEKASKIAALLLLVCSLTFASCISAAAAPIGPALIPEFSSVKQSLKQTTRTDRRPPSDKEPDENKNDTPKSQGNSKESAFDKVITGAEAALKAGDTERAARIFRAAQTSYPDKIEPYIGRARVLYILGQEEKALQLLDSIQDRFPLYPELYAMRGNIYFSQNKMSAARDQFYLALSLNTDDSDSCYRLAQIALLNYSPQEAIFYLKPALIMNPSNKEARVLLARLEWQAGNLADAQREMNNASLEDPGNSVLMSENALLLLESGKTLEALERMLQAYKLDPESPEIQKQLLTIYGVRKDWSSAQDAATSWVQLEPLNPKAHLMQGWCMLLNREIDEANAALKEAARLAANDPEVHNIYGIALSEKRKTEEAGLEFRKATLLCPDYLPSLLNELALKGMQGEFAEAIERLEKLELDYPGNHDIVCLRAFLEARDCRWKDLERTLAEFEQKIEGNVLLMTARGILLRRQGKFEESLKLLNSAIKLDPASVTTLCQLSTTYLEAGRTEESMKVSQQALQLAPNNIEAKSAMAAGLARAKNYDGSILLLKECVARSPKNAGLRIALAKIQLAKGDIYMAENTLLKAGSLFPDNYEVPLGLADIARRQMQYAKAVIYLDQAILLSPGLQEAISMKANCLYSMGKAEAALDTLSLISIESRKAEDLLLAARTRYKLADYADAAKAFREAENEKAALDSSDYLNYLKCCLAVKNTETAEILSKKLGQLDIAGDQERTLARLRVKLETLVQRPRQTAKSARN